MAMFQIMFVTVAVGVIACIILFDMNENDNHSDTGGENDDD